METTGCTRPPDEPDPLEAHMDFFHKLGYSTAQVTAVLKKFGSSIDTDKVLGELVQMRADSLAKQGPVTTMSVLVTKGDTQYADPTIMLPLASQSKEDSDDEEALRDIVIDGSNVAMSHGNKEVFSCLGIQLAVDFFLKRGHTNITVFVPSWRKEQPRPDVPISDQKILEDLEKKKHLTFTPSRRVGGKRVVCNDDFFIVKMAYDEDGVIVSNDMYRDLQADKPEWKRFIETRLLMYSFVNDKFMVPDDPLGRYGPNLKNFLQRFPKTQKKPPCPYGRKCTFGLKCKFHHPERANQSPRLLADALRENTKNFSSIVSKSSDSSPVPNQSFLLVEEMAKKLTVGLEKGSFKKGTHCSRQKASSPKKEKASLGSSDHCSLKQLDSGIGSIDGQSMEAPPYGATSGSYQPVQEFSERRAPCHCCPHGPASWRSFHQRPVHRHSSCDILHSDSPHYASYGGYPVSNTDHFQHGHLEHMYWSDPIRPHAPICRFPCERSPREPSRSQALDPNLEERNIMRKKLLAIYSAHLVDAAMDMFPHVVDPQMLVAEIVMMQSHNKMR
uniref:endoribonuclease ZC3H12A n=1 Tax=Doryrhamphus excisus TaxID=161450 RepID=UPI0025AE4467|nr:endoribonuclease ZC3H12A [Doryrhamphus excisus]XP_057902207.1 endoribonuclease ZC3H12A [Doryrhamphus excisus]XP_057902208.1 endoribonuclease ZC3H12A [Doryrhamphus excisus]XP_057902209.1 endoribonuclease ZC3H12A [Doryrhamphus excisus]XP_057902212.1 endoribonuclease ZC3H12A [Doryrhamphus excisus]XP_057902213.1 endoribonuclease ZC3H12A [Doryrhamphus excisus]XP_057902214.1 endoribonuclease ZC3H12A [Doryrhamphus excisus]XP_057902215.1 endoribonuclease ZC3H12A [Doryrhamphus excisus]XP_05790221